MILSPLQQTTPQHRRLSVYAMPAAAAPSAPQGPTDSYAATAVGPRVARVGGQLEVQSAGQGMSSEGTTLLVLLPMVERGDSVPAAL